MFDLLSVKNFQLCDKGRKGPSCPIFSQSFSFVCLL